MAKIKTSKRIGKSSKKSLSKNFDLDDFKGVRLKKDLRLQEHDPSTALLEKEIVLKAIFEALEEGDDQAFKEILRGHFEAVSKTELAEKSGISRRTLFRMLSADSNPTLNNIAKVIKILKSA